MTTATQMALEVTAVDQAALAQQLRSQWNAGVTALLAALPDWAAALDTHGEDLLVLPDAVAGALGVDSLLTSWATANLKTIDEATSLNTLTDLRTALQNLGYGSACVLGDAACDRNLLAVPIVASLSDQGTSIPYDDTMNSQLTGLAPGAALAADLNPSLDLSFDWNLGVDETAFYLEPLTIFDASITSADPMTGQSPLPGGAFSLLAQPTSQVTADLHLALAAAGAPVRLRAAQFSDPTTTFQSTATASAEIALDWSLQLDGGDTGYTFTDAWMLSSADGTVTVTDNLAPVSGDVLLSSLTSRLSDTLDQYFQPELLDKIGELVLPFTGSLEAKSVTTSRAVADHDASGDSIWMDRFVGWLRGLVDVPQGGQGLFATEGDQWLEADRLRHRAGVSGAGIKIAVISDGIATSGAEPTTWTALNRAITTGDLPALRTDESQPGPWVDVRRAGFGSGGIGMMEIIHDVAPDAQLLFWGIDAPFETNDAEDKQVLFIEGAKALIAAGADVIVDDYSFLNDTWFQDSWFTAQLRELLETHGVTWITSAGDDRLNHFQETMAPDSTAMGDLHIIDPGNDVDGRFVLQVQASTSGNHRLSLQWNDSFYDPQNRLVLHRVDYAPATKTITGTVATSEAQPSASAELFFSLDQGETAYFVVELAQQAKPDVLPEFEIFGDRGLVFQVDPTQRGDALVSHKSLPHVLVVGAMDIAQPNQVSPTSNAGPSTRRGQTPVPSLDVLGVSGVKVSGAGGASRRFDGTGAAAAHVAAVSGLLMELLEKDGRPQTQWRALITDALTGSAQTFSGEDYTDEEGYGLINAVRAADRLGLLPPDDGSQPLLPPRVPTSSALGLIGIDVQMTSDDALRAFLSGDATQLSNDQLVTLSFTVPEHAFAPLSAEFDFSLGKDTLGALDQFGLEGTVRGTFLPEALVQFGLDTAGSYLDSATHIGGRVVVEPAARGRHFSSTVQLVGNIQARPVLTFDPGAGRMRLGDVGEHLANDVRLALDPVAAGEPATITGTVDADLVLGFLDYVDVDPRLPNTAHGGDPFRIRGSAGLGIELTDLSASSLANVQFTWGQLDLKNPDVDEDGVQDYTAGVFLANALEAGYALIDGIGLADYLSGLASGFGESVSQVMATVTKPRGALPEDIPPTADAERARTMIRQRIEEGAADANDSGILQAMAEWLSGSGDPDDTNLSVKERINRLDPGSPDFDGNQTWGEFRDSLIAALGDWELFNRTLSALWGGRDTAPSQQVSLLDQLRLSVADAIAEAIRRAHDDAIAIFHANPRGPARDGGDGYLDRAYDMVQWATTADFFNLTDVRTDISPRYVMEHLPLRVVIVNEETSLVAQTEDGLLGKDDEALFRAKAGIQFKHTGVPINADPKAPDYDSKFGAPVFDTQQVVIRARGRDNSNRVSGAPATENSTLDQLLELVGLPGIDWFDSERNDGSVELTTDATGVVRTSVHLGENDTLAQVEFTAGIKELPLAESRTEVVLGRPHVELEGGVAGNDSVSDSPPLVGPQQSVLLRARVVRGRGTARRCAGHFLPAQRRPRQFDSVRGCHARARRRADEPGRLYVCGVLPARRRGRHGRPRRRLLREGTCLHGQPQFPGGDRRGELRDGLRHGQSGGLAQCRIRGRRRGACRAGTADRAIRRGRPSGRSGGPAAAAGRMVQRSCHGLDSRGTNRERGVSKPW
ncbi:MAG: hypothetical protein KatS3mg111_2007 [Pirellulaceae bacterium]|nr:MAG: hypothetical protein KatS3mg111_2007 [Pirellulaceae bacterium]